MSSVSIILPVYNGEKFIKGTINSILTQDFCDFELIIIDDGSTDNSLKIIKEFALNDKRIVLISQKNKGICISRNIGIAISKSPFIMFCDHDDIFLPGYIKQAFNDIFYGNFDFVKYGCIEIYVNDSGEYKRNVNALNDAIYTNTKKMLFEFTNYNEYIWDGIYTKDILTKICGFDSWYKAGCEDIDLMLKLVTNSKNCKTSHLTFYEHFIRNSSSTSRKFNENTYEAVIRILLKRLNVVEGTKIQLEEYKSKKNAQFLWSILGMFSFKNCNLTFYEIKDRLKKISSLDAFKSHLTFGKNSTSKKIVILLFKLKLFSILSTICIFKRLI